MTASRLFPRLAIAAVAMVLVVGCSSSGASTAPSAEAPSAAPSVAASAAVPSEAPAAQTYEDLTVGFIQTGSEGGWRAANTESFKSTATELGIDPQVLRRPEQAGEPAVRVPQLHRR